MVIIPKSHAEWLEARKTGLGASDSGAIIGVSKWKSNLQLWEEKVGLRKAEDISNKPQVQYGHDAEEHLRALFALDHPELEVTYESPYKMIFSDKHPFIFATPDGELRERATGRKGGLEIKTTEIQNNSQWAQWRGRIPDTYFSQVLHQMIATGWEFVWLRAQIKWRTRNGELRIEIKDYLIERHEKQEDLEYLEPELVKFWHHVQTKTPPPLKLPAV